MTDSAKVVVSVKSSERDKSWNSQGKKWIFCLYSSTITMTMDKMRTTQQSKFGDSDSDLLLC